MHRIAKILLGLILLSAGIYWIFYGSSLREILGVSSGTALADFLVVVNGIVPPTVALVGLFVLWLEWDEWKIERELEAERRKLRRKRR